MGIIYSLKYFYPYVYQDVNHDIYLIQTIHDIFSAIMSCTLYCISMKRHQVALLKSLPWQLASASLAQQV